jgi:hypothetical protein
MKIRIKERHREDYLAYLEWGIHHPEVYGWTIPNIEQGDTPPLEAFVLWDSQGKLVPTTRVETLRTVIHGKMSLNFNIKQWAQGYQDVYLFEIQRDYAWLPDWVWKSVTNQITQGEQNG